MYIYRQYHAWIATHHDILGIMKGRFVQIGGSGNTDVKSFLKTHFTCVKEYNP